MKMTLLSLAFAIALLGGSAANLAVAASGCCSGQCKCCDCNGTCKGSCDKCGENCCCK